MGCSPWGHKELDTTEHTHMEALLEAETVLFGSLDPISWTLAFTLIYSGCVAWPLALRAGSYSFRSHPRPQKGDIHLLRRHLLCDQV